MKIKNKASNEQMNQFKSLNQIESNNEQKKEAIIEFKSFLIKNYISYKMFDMLPNIQLKRQGFEEEEQAMIEDDKNIIKERLRLNKEYANSPQKLNSEFTNDKDKKNDINNRMDIDDEEQNDININLNQNSINNEHIK